MFDENKENKFILQLFNLEYSDVQDVSCIRAETLSLLTLLLLLILFRHPVCGCDQPHIRTTSPRTLPTRSFRQAVHSRRYHARRYVCPVCGKTYYEHNPFVFKSMKISALTVYSILSDLKNYNETFSSVAKDTLHLFYYIASIFDSHVDMKERRCQMINFDEVYARSDDSKYVCMLLDFGARASPVDALPSRRYDYLHSYFSLRIPKEERDNVRYVCSDMYDCYRSIAGA